MNSSDLRIDPTLLRSPVVWAWALAGALALSTPAQAASADDIKVPDASNMTAKQAYQHDVAYCNSGEATQPRALCLKEAQRAYREAAGGGGTGKRSATAHRSTSRKSGNASK
ncbi:MAG TPA: hypothetical protein VFP68_02500 [Burkholderiaceae bacterium]|nr:hypothetical protein [Burkholderiaceae bacterium]